MPDVAKQFFQNPTGSLVTVKCFPWIVKDKLCLIGDAAHAIVPFFGQGMNCGFEDCTVLSEILDTHSENDWENAFKEFEVQRKLNADAIAYLALENFIEMRDKVADIEFLRRKKIERLLQNQYSDKFLPLYSMVTFSHIPYHLAQIQGKKQDYIIERLLSIHHIESDWNSVDNQAIIQKIMTEE